MNAEWCEKKPTGGNKAGAPAEERATGKKENGKTAGGRRFLFRRGQKPPAFR